MLFYSGWPQAFRQPPDHYPGGVPQVFHSNLANFLDGACSALSIHPSDYLPNFYLDDKDQAFGDIFGGPCCVNLDRSS